MAITVNHSTPADDSFSASGATAWNANHSLVGVGTMAEQNANNVAITGGSITGVTIGSATNIAGGSTGQILYQSASGTTTFLTAGASGQVLSANAGGIPVWITNTVGTVTSVGGTGTVNGLTLTGSVTTSGNLTLGGTLDLSSPPAIGGTTPNNITGYIITADSKFVSGEYYAQSILGGNLRTSGGTSLLNWDGGGSGNITVNGGLNANPTNKNISLAPTGTGSVTVNPATTGAMNNMIIGGTTPLAGTFTSLTATSGIGGGEF
jgi:hypothetical protein